jgi:hypothetical protein
VQGAALEDRAQQIRTRRLHHGVRLCFQRLADDRRKACPLAADFGLPGPLPVEVAGLICGVFGPVLLWAARRDLGASAVLVLAALDAGWIAGSLLAAACAACRPPDSRRVWE